MILGYTKQDITVALDVRIIPFILNEILLIFKWGMKFFSCFRKRRVQLPKFKPGDLSDHHVKSNLERKRVLTMTYQNNEDVFLSNHSFIMVFVVAKAI